MAATFTHQLSGEQFVATTGEGRFGAASVDGVWASTGQTGTIWPAERLSDGTLLWVRS